MDMMDVETKKEVEIKNIIDIFLENLRINHQTKDNESFGEYQLISEEDLNVEQLILRNPEFGAKLLKNFRKVLHREIRDWTIQPLQKKQTSFNRKINENLSSLYLQTKSNQKNNVSVSGKVDSVSEKVDSVSEKVDSNLPSH